MSPLDRPPHEATLAQVRASAPGASGRRGGERPASSSRQNASWARASGLSSHAAWARARSANCAGGAPVGGASPARRAA